MRLWLFSILSVICALAACRKKVGLEQDPLRFVLAKAFWFEDESTFFLFYHIDNPQPFRTEGLLEMSLNQGETWQDVNTGTYVHPHESVDCGNQTLCGSLSIRWTQPLPSAQLRYRFHRDAELAESLVIPVVIVRKSSPLRRSFYIYGVFDQTNVYVQWRGRHFFPGLSHEEAEAYGLRRPYRITGIRSQTNSSDPDRINPSLYGSATVCAGTELNPDRISSDRGADSWLMAQVELSFAQACGISEVTDGNGSYSAAAFARKNPIVEPIEQDLQLAFTKAKQIPLIFASCKTIDQNYLDFQVERMHFPTNRIDYCMDDGTFSRENVLALLYGKVLAAQEPGQVLALVLILHYTLQELSPTISDVLGQSLAAIANNALFPRVSAVFVYDSFAPESPPAITQPSVIWCPVAGDASTTLSTCAFQPSQIALGSIEIRSAPALPDYENFQKMDDVQKRGATVEDFSIYTPKEPGSGGRLSITQTNDRSYVFNPFDQLPVLASESLSYCGLYDSTEAFAFEILPSSGTQDGGIPVSPLSVLPGVHRLQDRDQVYNLGLQLDVPFLVSVRY
ncbi:MAG: hypothetical protein M3Q07_17630, partial [Pseudobdellovibrionaceae bacterium]|nr:hypothetical protein [Pseudobdellovibrionaceae bacterium]